MNQKILLIPADGFRPDALTTGSHPYGQRLPKNADIRDIASAVTQLLKAAAAREQEGKGEL